MTLDAWNSTTITYSGDVDWWVFTVRVERSRAHHPGWIAGELSARPVRVCSTPIWSSNRPGVQYEELYPYLVAGTYRVEVTGVAGAFASSANYDLKVRTLPEKVLILSSSGWDEFPDEPRIVGEVLNNTSIEREDVAIKVRFYNAANVLLATRTTYARRERFNGRQRSMFVWADEVFPGFDHYSVAIKKAPVATYPVFTGLSVHPVSATPDLFGGIDFTGNLHNSTAFHVGIPRVMMTIYDAWGGVVNADFNDTAPDPMLPHSSNPYLIHLNDRNTGNRTVFTAHGYQN